MSITRLASRLRPFAHLSRAEDPKDDKDKDKNAVDPKDDDKDEKNGAVDPKDDDDDEKNGATDPEESGPTDEVGDENEPNAKDSDDDDDEMAKARKAGHAAGLASAKRQGARAERRRVAAIFKSKSAAGRIEQAATLAFTTRLSAREAISVLAASPRQQAAASGDLTLLNRSIPHTRVSPHGGIAETPQTPGQRLLEATKKLAAQPRPRG